MSGLLIGARLNIGLNSVYKNMASMPSGGQPSFVPKVDVKNNLFQVTAGWIFGKKSSRSSKQK